ncbi:class III extradiol dioxygenase subunit B-like domain-containing protein [Streptomyces sp. TRM 70351]|uniref:class III extradiol dioxygenase subunit B-like domain-containing protein n=1 Tax=Streptomyces sp. TRM 70351 TaxID=3116552 RepID=UPI002E7BC9AD|nr:class III extradiol dioxygenase subunit B-like domain-containing protein [Streptomyces sp. TRM 70351]MEE1926602.1 class III extradiol dioxygenase subunit B-like domain-containing protein [Streptomyces sp. TRM 70351]
MLAAAAACPCPPLLVPEVARGAAHEMDDARSACAEALDALAAARPDRLAVVGPADPAARGAYPPGSRGSFSGFGVDLTVTLGRGPGGERPLPASLAVAAWLLERHGWDAAPVTGRGVGQALAPEHCAAAGRELVQGEERVALLVMGDGSACRTLKAPGYFDERAAAYDAEAARALGTADTAGLAALDAELGYELQVSGRAGWQVLAGAGRGTRLTGKLLYDSAPYGVGYLVARWS